jgi:hypothetical protein
MLFSLVRKYSRRQGRLLFFHQSFLISGALGRLRSVMLSPSFFIVSNSIHVLTVRDYRAFTCCLKKQWFCPQRSTSPRKLFFVAMKKEEPTAKPPLNIPSGILLALSCVLAIAFVGSIFELSSVSDTTGYIT